jgi:hypothetical protein
MPLWRVTQVRDARRAQTPARSRSPQTAAATVQHAVAQGPQRPAMPDNVVRCNGLLTRQQSVFSSTSRAAPVQPGGSRQAVAERVERAGFAAVNQRALPGAPEPVTDSDNLAWAVLERSNQSVANRRWSPAHGS